jgi:membrane associated rhomboid family serine protease
MINYALIASCVIVFGYQLTYYFQSTAALDSWIDTYALVPRRFLAAWAQPAAWPPLFTSMFLHGDLLHLLRNCWFLRVFGDNVEDRLGHGVYPFFYVTCGLVAAGAHLLAEPTSLLPTLGASGAISGVLGAYLVFYPRAWIMSLAPWFTTILPLPALVFLPLWFGLQIWMGLRAPDHAGGVAWWAHAGGFVAGGALALLLRRHTR